MRSGDGALFEKAIRDLPDALSRVAFLKNSETMLTPELLELFRPLVRVIVAGDLSKTNEGHALRTLPWRTPVPFEDLPAYALSVPSALDRYRAWASGVWSGEVALA